MNAFLISASVLLVAAAVPLLVVIRRDPIDGLVALQLSGTLATLTLLCLAEGFHRSVYFDVSLVAAGATWIGGLVFARFLGRVL